METYYITIKENKIKNFETDLEIYKAHIEIIEDENFIFAYSDFVNESTKHNDKLL